MVNLRLNRGKAARKHGAPAVARPGGLSHARRKRLSERKSTGVNKKRELHLVTYCDFRTVPSLSFIRYYLCEKTLMII